MSRASDSSLLVRSSPKSAFQNLSATPRGMGTERPTSRPYGLTVLRLYDVSSQPSGFETCSKNTRKRGERSDSVRSLGSFEADHAWNVRWVKAARRVLKPYGTLWVSGTHYIVFSLGFALQSLGFIIINPVVWQKPDPVPNALHNAFTHACASWHNARRPGSPRTPLRPATARPSASQSLRNHSLRSATAYSRCWRGTAPGGRCAPPKNARVWSRNG